MNAIVGLLSVVSGVVLLVHSLDLRRGRRPGSRDWIHFGERRIRSVVLTLPAVGAGLLALGLSRRDPGDSRLFLPVLVSVWIFILSGLPVRVPAWLLPSWARGSVRGRRAAEERARLRAAQEQRARRAAEDATARRRSASSG